MKTMNLSAIADIQCGLVLNRKQAKNADTAKKHYKRLNMRALQEDGHLNAEELDGFCSLEYLGQQFLTRAGDIVIRLLAPLSPVLIRENEAGFVIPSQLAVIRRKDNSPVLPEYLRWYLSLPEVSGRLISGGDSYVQRSIKIGELSALPIPVPPLEKQALIARIYEAGFRRSNLYRELANQEAIYMNGLLQKAIGGTTK